MSRDLREEVARLFYEASCIAVMGKRGFELHLWENQAQQVRDAAFAYADAALTAARPVIERETREACAKVAENYGPSRPMATNMAFSVIRGRWEGEQAASANIAAAIRGEPT